MAKSKELDRKSDSHHHLISLSKLSSRCMKVCGHNEKKPSANTEWEDAECSVCLEFPHNAVLLLCSSYNKGCRPYMCATSHRYSNCLDQYTKATTNKTSRSRQMSSDSELPGVSCPLCRGQVKGWTVVEPARSYLNEKKRPCVQEGCSFIGRYKELRKHVRSKHPLARPRDIDPLHAKKWQKLENERDLSDVLSTIRSSMPGAIVIGDYVIDYGSSDDDMDMVGSFYRASSYTRAGPVVERRNPPQQRVGLVVSRSAARRSSGMR